MMFSSSITTTTTINLIKIIIILKRMVIFPGFVKGMSLHLNATVVVVSNKLTYLRNHEGLI